MKKLISISILPVLIFIFNGCLTPYDNEFTCRPSIIGRCTKSVVKTYKQTLKEIDRRENEKVN